MHFGTHTPTPTHTTLLAAFKHRSAACQPSASGAFWDTHTNTNTHYTAIIASKHRSAVLPTQRSWCMRWNVFVSAVQSCPCGAFGTTNTTHTENISLRCALGCGKQIPSQKYRLVLKNHIIQTATLQASNQTALRTTPWHANNLTSLVVHFGTHTPTRTHTTQLVACKHRSAAPPTQRSWCMRWNVCSSAVRSCPCGAFGTTNTIHTKHVSLRCALGCGKQIPSPKKRLVLTKT